MDDLLAVFSSVMHGSITSTALILGIGAIAVLLDLLVRYLNRRGVSHHLCWLLDKTVLLLAAIDCSLVLAIAACNAWEARPMVMRAHGPGAAVEVATSGTTRR